MNEYNESVRRIYINTYLVQYNDYSGRRYVAFTSIQKTRKRCDVLVGHHNGRVTELRETFFESNTYVSLASRKQQALLLLHVVHSFDDIVI